MAEVHRSRLCREKVVSEDKKWPVRTALALCMWMALSLAGADENKRSCKLPEATSELVEGLELQKDGNSEEAVKAYQTCISLDPDCAECRYEIGWSYWKLGEWDEVIKVWEQALQLAPDHPQIPQFLPSARQNLAAIEKKVLTGELKRNIELLSVSEPAEAPVQMTFVGRWQSYKRAVTHPLDRFDSDIDSPKSVNFNPDGTLVFVNSLEGAKTVVFDGTGTSKKASISHRFTAGDAALFNSKPPFDYTFPADNEQPNVFVGKPVEGEFSHGGRFYWAPYYRRSYDEMSHYPSAMAIIDTKVMKVARVISTGPIAKNVLVSPDGDWLAVAHWGDNTVGLYDISADEVSAFKEVELLTVEARVPATQMTGDRDHDCGFCVRGLAFSRDGRFLFVSRMRKGGIAVFDLSARPRRYLGTIDGIAPGPRDLKIDSRGQYLYLSCNATGFIWKVSVAGLIENVSKANGKRVKIDPRSIDAISGFAGLSVRSIKIAPGDDYLFAAVNQTSEIVAFRTSDLEIVARIPVDSYPVGLDLSPDGSELWVTSQGRKASGGNSVGVFQVRYKNGEIILKTKGPTAER
jgi:DNA-binding beta-propeller fold protein YncE